MLRKAVISLAVISVVLLFFIADLLIDGGTFKTIEPHFDGQCEIIEGVVGAEDITIDPTNGLAYVSAHDRRNWSGGGNIYRYHTGSLSKPQALAHDLDEVLFPHGISLWKSPEGADRLFVVNHPPAPPGSEQRSDSEVIIFDVENSALKFVRRITTDLPYSLNDVAAANSESFYATIDKGSLTKLGRLFESYGRLALGGIAFGSEGKMTRVMGDLVYPNGIQVSLDGSKLYVSESSGKHLISFDRDINTGALSFNEQADLGSGLDNLEWDLNGNLWIGAHPKMLDYVQHSANHQNRSASQVLRVNMHNQMSIDEIYLSDGTPLSGSSVAAPYQDHVLIGSVYEPFILDCTLNTVKTPPSLNDYSAEFWSVKLLSQRKSLTEKSTHAVRLS